MVLVLEMVLKLVLLGGLIGSITGGILGGIGEGIDYLMQQPKITITQRIQQMMQPNPHGDGALAFKGEYLGVDKAGNQIVASTNDAVVIGHHIPFHVPIHEVNPGLNGFPIEFAVLLAAFAPESVAGFESGATSETEYTYTNTAAKHLTEMIQHGENTGQLVRPYMKSPLTIEEIMSTGEGPVYATFEGGMNWQVSGAFRGSQGTWELGLNPETRIIYHFNFVSF